MKTRKFFKKKHKGFIILLLFVLIWIGFLFFASPRELVELIGVETGYLVIFLTALIGVSGFTSLPYYISLITLASSGEFNVFYLVFLAAPACAIGDTVFFFLGYKGHYALDEFTNKRLKIFSIWINKRNPWKVPLFAYIYTSIAPLPQDILMIALGLGRVKFWPVFIAVLFGNANFIALVYLLSVYIFPELWNN